jgi:arylsulfatase A-like enzyme
MNKFDNTRRGFLKVVGLGAVSMAVSKPSPAAAKNRPNVIIVITDDQGYGDLACHGNKIIKTPNLDKLYGETVHLNNFHVGPTCAPTRAALMTGRYCNRTGVWHTVMGRSMLRKDEVTVADVFGDNGYSTGIFGKWHLGDNYPFRPDHHGFQEVMVHGGGGVTQTPDYWDNDYFDDTYYHNGKWKPFSGYCTDVWFDGAMSFIEKNKTKPFFCYLTTNAPHGPYLVGQKYIDMYKDNENVPNPAFYGMITNIDDNMARLDKKLRDLGLRDNTIFIFMTDNGTAAGFKTTDGDVKGFNAGMRGTKGSEYDGGHRVPCFIRWPAEGITKSRDINRITAHVDLLPTLADLCGIEPAKDVLLDGDSLKPLLLGDGKNWPDRVLITDSQRIEFPEKWRKSAVMTDRWRLVNGKELYDMPADPGQENDVAAENPKVVKRLRDEYEKWWASVSERFDEYCETIIGTEHEDPVTLTCHDWHESGLPPWNHGQIRRGPKNNGFWAVEIARDGTYEFALRRWPIEVDKPITAAIPGGEAINAVKARIKIANQDETKPFGKSDVDVKFRLTLKPGKTTMQTWFIDDKGDAPRGAYYVYARLVK